MRMHRDVVVDLVRANGWRAGVELGLASGQLFGRLLETFDDLHMIGVDRALHKERIKQVRAIANRFPDRAVVHEMLTSQAAVYVENDSRDFVFIDADHSYEGCRDDIAMWTPKVRPGGTIMGHDYNAASWPGVIRAVDQAFGRRVVLHDDCVWSVQL